MKASTLEFMIKKLGISPDATKSIPDYDELIYVSVLDEETGNEKTFLVYDCSGNNLFNIDRFKSAEKFVEDEYKDDLFNYLFIFDNLDCEEKQKKDVVKNLKNFSEKKEVNDIFQMKKAIYTQGGDIALKVDNGINYLEYPTNNNVQSIKGYVYNVSYYELKKLFNVTGRELFRENIRDGIVTNYQAKNRLRREFRKYLLNGVFNLVKKDENEVFDKILCEYLSENEEIQSCSKECKPDMFWFNHNGVTIYISSRELNRSGNEIRFDSEAANILNGAQTMTNLYGLVGELRDDLIHIAGKAEAEEYVKSLLDIVCEKIIIKTIFINGDTEYIRGISNGLNTQVPITDLELIASEEEVSELNRRFKGVIKIIKPGEYCDKKNITVLDFAKKYQIINGKPGTSKNLNKNTVKQVVGEALDRDSEKLINDLKLTIDTDEWWGKNVNDINTNTEIDDVVKKYGRNYFGSYVLDSQIQLLDSEKLEQLYVDFVFDIKNINEPVEMKDFKKDELYSKILNQKKKRKVSSIFSDEFANELINYLNEIEISKNVSAYIAKFLNKKGINIDRYKTISASEEEGEVRIYESMSFPSGTFFEINNAVGYDISFEDSLFKKEVLANIYLFVLIKNKETKEYTRVIPIKDFGFKEYENDARIVFDSTVECFKEGDETKFTKISDKKSFHVRPHAASSDDTFQFSNGKDIVKSTFWANRETIEEIVNKYIKSKPQE